jgi:hypothetical protein
MLIRMPAAIPRRITAGYPESDGSATHCKEVPMTLTHQSGDGSVGEDTLVEECIEELDELVMSLDRFPPAAVAVAMGAHLEGLLGALIDEHLCTAEEARALLREVELGALGEPSAARR